MCDNKLILAAAGSGKTRLIVREALANPQERVLITTFTIANLESIKRRIMKKNHGTIPSNVFVQTWFSFLIEHGVRPYRYWEKRVVGMKFVKNSSEAGYQSIRKLYGKDIYVPWREESDFEKHYFTSNMNVYSDKLPKLVIRCDKTPKGKQSNGLVINRIVGIFKAVYIDEVQDMAGYDLDIIELLLRSGIRTTMVGDPRQTVYQTHHERKHDQYSKGGIKDFILSLPQKRKQLCKVDDDTLRDSHRNSSVICALASKLFTDYSECRSLLTGNHEHSGIFFVRRSDVHDYGRITEPLQLRLNKNVSPLLPTQIMNYGESKGLEAEHVLIYPTVEMLRWLNGEKISLEFKTKAQLYVAITRAFFSVGIVVEDDFSVATSEIALWTP